MAKRRLVPGLKNGLARYRRKRLAFDVTALGCINPAPALSHRKVNLYFWEFLWNSRPAVCPMNGYEYLLERNRLMYRLEDDLAGCEICPRPNAGEDRAAAGRLRIQVCRALRQGRHRISRASAQEGPTAGRPALTRRRLPADRDQHSRHQETALSAEHTSIRGARTHNLKDISLELPHQS